MQLLKHLAAINVISKNGIARSRKQGLFYCPECKEDVVRPLGNGEKSATCGRKGCRKTTQPTHNSSGSKLYTIWHNIRIRCNNPDEKHYGGKGISYPIHWNTFEGFFMDMGLSYTDGMSIDRHDSDKSYSKENCQWVPFSDNCAKEKQKPIGKYTVGGVFVCSYVSVKKAADAEGFPNTSCISQVARGERKQYRGFVWKYI